MEKIPDIVIRESSPFSPCTHTHTHSTHTAGQSARHSSSTTVTHIYNLFIYILYLYVENISEPSSREVNDRQHNESFSSIFLFLFFFQGLVLFLLPLFSSPHEIPSSVSLSLSLSLSKISAYHINNLISCMLIFNFGIGFTVIGYVAYYVHTKRLWLL